MGLHLRVDADLPADVVDDLRTRGHDVVVKASIGGSVRLVERCAGFIYGLDDGRHEGLTVGWKRALGTPGAPGPTQPMTRK
jgi:gamma-glutamyltranspeptidase / glutathione hydrolase